MSEQIAKDYFEFIANIGITKHPGSMAATRKLIKLCHIEGEKYVLDVGCGVGATPVYLAKSTGCRVVGVDLLEKMVEQSRARVKAEGLGDRVEFKVADARELPFEDDLFDAVISESVNVFFDDKQVALNEYARVTKPGGYVGLAEIAWLTSPKPEMEESLKEMAYIMALEADDWKALLVGAGLKNVVGEAEQIDLSRESKGRLERYGWWQAAKGGLKALGLSITDRRSRTFMKQGMGAVSREMLEVMGNGVFVGQKV
jgi:ubiquinone/menaquinone biosynthesis C-methylase UbiE